ncbi:hypothetical protein QR680_008667 [Steinernema hermaphroditum]|uniref:Uncharacterized protein n=1 Tax=Steinernema hermaphroditum TaxID=289476 RepID=A0AA39IJD7_9BILA|nr:hypothetical protein QR680_008667 [Steinernema hermaphroditum]
MKFFLAVILVILRWTVADIGKELKQKSYNTMVREAMEKKGDIDPEIYRLWEALCHGTFPVEIFPNKRRPMTVSYKGTEQMDGKCAKDDEEKTRYVPCKFCFGHK